MQGEFFAPDYRRPSTPMLICQDLKNPLAFSLFHDENIYGDDRIRTADVLRRVMIVDS